MTEKFMFGDHPSCVRMMQHCMTTMRDAGALVTVETELCTHHDFVLHTVCAVMPPNAHPVKFTRARE
jgi:hypothetical protein